MPVLPKATSPNRGHQQKSEESTGISARLKRFASPAGFFAPLRMTNSFEDKPGASATLRCPFQRGIGHVF
jgi:hypothetical protein